MTTTPNRTPFQLAVHTFIDAEGGEGTLAAALAAEPAVLKLLDAVEEFAASTDAKAIAHMYHSQPDGSDGMNEAVMEVTDPIVAPLLLALHLLTQVYPPLDDGARLSVDYLAELRGRYPRNSGLSVAS